MDYFAGPKRPREVDSSSYLPLSVPKIRFCSGDEIRSGRAQIDAAHVLDGAMDRSVFVERPMREGGIRDASGVLTTLRQNAAPAPAVKIKSCYVNCLNAGDVRGRPFAISIACGVSPRPRRRKRTRRGLPGGLEPAG
jgi:hypothetical protein